MAGVYESLQNKSIVGYDGVGKNMDIHHNELYILAVAFSSAAIAFGLGAIFDIWKALGQRLFDKDAFTTRHFLLEKALIVLSSVLFSVLCVGNAALIAQYAFSQVEVFSFGFAYMFMLTSIVAIGLLILGALCSRGYRIDRTKGWV